jgi:hypothetical protein
MSTPQDLPELRVDAESLYREELFTDRRIGTIRKLVPVRADGAVDSGRPAIFEGQTTLVTPAGPVPLAFEIEADTLADAVERFPDAAQRALERTLRELEEIRREAASSLIVPARGPLGIDDVGGPGGGKIRLR